MGLNHKISSFRTNEPESTGSATPLISFLKLIPKEKKSVLVIGCGQGHEVGWFIKQGFIAKGVTNQESEAVAGRKKYGVEIAVSDMHDLPFKEKFDAIFASNVLEHSIAPYLALTHWRDILKNDGLLVLVMPSKEWVKEYYHFSVLTHSQTKDLLFKAGYELLAGPEYKSTITLPAGSDIFYDLGRKWGHYDGYLAKKSDMPKGSFMLGEINQTNNNTKEGGIFKKLIKIPFNKIRVFYTRRHRE